jgi:hypothetical protein
MSKASRLDQVLAASSLVIVLSAAGCSRRYYDEGRLVSITPGRVCVDLRNSHTQRCRAGRVLTPVDIPKVGDCVSVERRPGVEDYIVIPSTGCR